MHWTNHKKINSPSFWFTSHDWYIKWSIWNEPLLQLISLWKQRRICYLLWPSLTTSESIFFAPLYEFVSAKIKAYQRETSAERSSVVIPVSFFLNCNIYHERFNRVPSSLVISVLLCINAFYLELYRPGLGLCWNKKAFQLETGVNHGLSKWC